MDPNENTPSEQPWVIKIGGSLLHLPLPDLADRMRTIIARTTTKPMIVVGGGNIAEEVRTWSKIHRLPDSASHWLAIHAMDFNRQLVEVLLPELVAVKSLSSARQVWAEGKVALLMAYEWMQLEEQNAEPLLHSWDITSDTIAARLATRWESAGLLLLKSVDPPATWRELIDSRKNLVDPAFATHAKMLSRLAWCNLKDTLEQSVELPLP